MATTTLLDGVTTAGRSAGTMTVTAESRCTLRAEGLAGDDKVLVEVQDIATTGWNDYRQNGKVVRLTPKQPEITFESMGVFTVSLESAPEGTVSVVGIDGET